MFSTERAQLYVGVMVPRLIRGQAALPGGVMGRSCDESQKESCSTHLAVH